MIAFASPDEALVWADFASRIAAGMHAGKAVSTASASTEDIRRAASASADRFLEDWRARKLAGAAKHYADFNDQQESPRRNG